MALFWLGRFFGKDVVDYSKGYYAQEKGDLGICYSFGEINHRFSSSSSALRAKYNEIVAAKIFAVNAKGFLVVNMAKIQATTKFDATADNTLSFALVSSIFKPIEREYHGK